MTERTKELAPDIQIRSAEPSAFQQSEIEDFVAFVLAGGEVQAKGLRERVMRAYCISFVRKNGCLVGVSGLKVPSLHHRREVAKASGTKLDAQEFPFELGWVFVLPSARGRNLAFFVCQSLLAVADGRRVFATSRVANVAMHRTLKKLGFSSTGRIWASRQNGERLLLFVRGGNHQRL